MPAERSRPYWVTIAATFLLDGFHTGGALVGIL